MSEKPRKKNKKISEVNLNDEAEVFVLPPDLLEQLGINLCSDRLDQGPSNENGGDELSKKSNKNISDESSILETANLMKKSVFLSPTFNTAINDTHNQECTLKDTPIVIPFVGEEDNTVVVDGQLAIKVSISVDSTELDDKEETRSNMKINNIDVYESIKEYEDQGTSSNLILTKVANSCNADEQNNIKSNKKNFVDDHLDEAYSSDFSNTASDTISSKVDNLLEPQPLIECSKIKIISEEVLDNTFQLKNRSKCKKNVKNTHLSPVSIDSGTAKSTDGCENKTNMKSKSNKPVTEFLSLENNHGKNTKHTDNYSTGKNIDTNVKNKQITTKVNDINVSNDVSTKYGNEMASKPFANNAETSHEKKDPEDLNKNTTEIKIQEIAGLLKQVMSERKKDSSKMTQNDDIIFKKANNKKIKSKDCSQGVEKPGGVDKTLKTYASKTSKKNRVPYETVDYSCIPDLHTLPDTELDCVKSSVQLYIDKEQLCICFDYGNFYFYDEEETYEHIHFRHHKNICDASTLFSIYSEQSVNIELEKFDFDDTYEDLSEPDTIQEDTNLSICWYNTKLEADYNVKANKTIKKDMASKITTNTEINKCQSSKLLAGVSNEQFRTEYHEYVNSTLETNSLPTIATAELSSSNESDALTKTKPQAMPPKRKVCNSLRNSSSNESTLEPTTGNQINNTALSIHSPIDGTRRKSTRLSQEVLITTNPSISNDETRSKMGRNSSKLDNIEQQSKLNKLNNKLESTKSLVDANKKINKINDSSTEVANNDSLCSEKQTISITTTEKSLTTSQNDVNNISTVKNISSHAIDSSESYGENPHAEKHIDKTNSNESNSTTSTVPIKVSSQEKESGETNEETKLVKPKTLTNDECLKRKSTAVEPEKNNDNKTNDGGQRPINQDSNRNIICAKTKCGVCKEHVEATEWFDHLKSHNYLAWKNTETPLDLKNQDIIEAHLKQIYKEHGSLICCNCGITRKFVRPYLRHIRSCDISEDANDVSTTSALNVTQESTLDDSITSSVKKHRREVKRSDGVITCGVCSQSVLESGWIEHIRMEHQYIAWKAGENPLNVEDEDEIWAYLNGVSKRCDGLICHKCGLNRRYVKQYLKHISVCEGSEDFQNSYDISTTSGLNGTQQSIPDESISFSVKKNEHEGHPSDDPVTCGVCSQSVLESGWIEHIRLEHQYMAWREGENPLNVNDEDEVWAHLNAIAKQDGLICNKCGLNRKYVKFYLKHIGVCQGPKDNINDVSSTNSLNSTHDSITNDSIVANKRKYDVNSNDPVTCGVCSQSVLESGWIEHIRLEHQYIAWREGENPLNVEDEDEVWAHLHEIAKYDGLICHKCGLSRKYVKHYLKHIVICKGPLNNLVNVLPLTFKEVIESTGPRDVIVKCDICKIEVAKKNWIEHIMKTHKYVAWIEGDTPLDLNDEEVVFKYLQVLAKKTGELICYLCNESRNNARAYQQHVNICEKADFKIEVVDPKLPEDAFECGVCHERGKKSQWRNHAMTKHYNIAWMVGEQPLNLRNPYSVEKYLKEYKKKYNILACKVCQETRISCFGFYAHILVCGKSESELDEVQNVCEICNNKYICIYRSQHMASHRDTEMRKERRERDAQLAKENKEKMEEKQEEETLPLKRRRAAVNAIKVIENFTNVDDNAEPVKKKRRMSSDSDVSIKLEPESEEESDDDVDSNISNEEPIEPVKKKSHSESAASKVVRIPFNVKSSALFLKQSYFDFCNFHLTNDRLFSDWTHKSIETIPENASKYLPKLSYSCKVRINNSDWVTYERFTADLVNKCTVLFAGASVRCMCWSPAPGDDASDTSEYLCVVTHRDADTPRYRVQNTHTHPGLIQIWTFNDFRSVPVFSLGLAHDFGTVWSMDWCPSGARDVIPEHYNGPLSAFRLGLLAIACSNGSAYILSVPYPPETNEGEINMCKVHPVAELRLQMSRNRKVYQATSITWSPQKAHNIIVVGYSDGTTACYDINTESPLLKSTNNGTTVFYPFQDRRIESGPISGTAVCATLDSGRCVGSVSTSAVSGGCVVGAGAGAQGLELRAPLASTAVLPLPHWPNSLLLAEVAISRSVSNEVEWGGCGRRAGAACAGAGCARCAVLALAAPPFIRLVHAHPSHTDINKRIVAMLQMVTLSTKRKLDSGPDGTRILVEPLTYDDAVQKYGLEFKTFNKKKQSAVKLCSEMEQRSNRYPLSEVNAASFCSSSRHHDKLAVASHSGLIFIMNTPSVH